MCNRQEEMSDPGNVIELSRLRRPGSAGPRRFKLPVCGELLIFKQNQQFATDTTIWLVDRVAPIGLGSFRRSRVCARFGSTESCPKSR